jgi:hypothetical protein
VVIVTGELCEKWMFHDFSKKWPVVRILLEAPEKAVQRIKKRLEMAD